MPVEGGAKTEAGLEFDVRRLTEVGTGRVHLDVFLRMTWTDGRIQWGPNGTQAGSGTNTIVLQASTILKGGWFLETVRFWRK